MGSRAATGSLDLMTAAATTFKYETGAAAGGWFSTTAPTMVHLYAGSGDVLDIPGLPPIGSSTITDHWFRQSAGLTGGTTAPICVLATPGSGAISLDYIGIRTATSPSHRRSCC